MMADRKALRERIEELARCTELGQYATVSGEDVRAVVELIREQEPHVLTWEEVDKSGNSYVWAEIKSFYTGRHCLIYCTVERSDFFDELYRLREDSGSEWTRTEEDYNRDDSQGSHSGWRCWTARPTEEQRKAVKWDD